MAGIPQESNEELCGDDHLEALDLAVLALRLVREARLEEALRQIVRPQHLSKGMVGSPQVVCGALAVVLQREDNGAIEQGCLLYTSPSPRDS